uniref:Uncharacterized protein n=1 Tax=Rhizophora mucronata TaxID=61149 RepID=A0A2P2P5T9_RHIMU
MQYGVTLSNQVGAASPGGQWPSFTVISQWIKVQNVVQVILKYQQELL